MLDKKYRASKVGRGRGGCRTARRMGQGRWGYVGLKRQPKEGVS